MTAPRRAPPGWGGARAAAVAVALSTLAFAAWRWADGGAGLPLATGPTSAQRAPDAGGPPLPQQRLLRGWVADERGLPVRGARVTLLATGAETLTDHAGAFGLQAPGDEPVDLEFSALHHSTVVAREVADTPGVHIVLERSATISGTVATPGGKPAVDAIVELAGSGVWPSLTTSTDAQGSYLFEGLPGGLYVLRAATETQVSPTYPPAEVDPGEGIRVDLALLPGASLAGRVLDAATGDPIEHAELSVGDPDSYLPPLLLATDAQGAFATGPLPNAQVRISAAAPGFVTQLGLEATPGGRETVLRMRRAAVLSGRIVDSAGRPVAGAQLEVMGTSRGKPIVLSHPGLAETVSPLTAAVTPFPLLPGDNLGVVPGPVPPLPIFAVLDVVAHQPGAASTGAAAGGAASTGAAAGGTDMSAAPGFYTDPEGRFEVGGVPGGRLRLLARSAAHATASTEMMSVRDGQRLDDLEIVLPDGFELRGLVIDTDGMPVAGTRISLELDVDPLPRGTVTDGDGRFTLQRLVGACTVVAHPAGYPAERRALIVGEGGNDVEIQLASRGHVARGRVFDPRGFPLEGALVSVDQGPGPAAFRLGLATQTDGTFEAQGLPPPPYQLRVTRRGFAPSVITYADERGEEISIKMESGAVLRLQTVDSESGDGIAGVPVHYRNAAGSLLGHALSETSGIVEVRDVSIGNYTISIDHSPYIPVRETVSAGGGDPAPTVALVASGSVSGVVVDSLGTPVYDALVTTAEAPDWEHAVHTDHEGHFQLGRLPPGQLRLAARLLGAGTVVLDRPVEVRARGDVPGVVLRLPERAPGTEPVQLAGGTAATGPREGVQASVEMRAGKITVTRVGTGSSAERGGLRVGDVVTEVDGERVFAAGQVRSMWGGEAGSGVATVVERKGKPRRLKLVRDRRP